LFVVCRYTNFALVKMDDDIVLNGNMHPTRSMCDRAFRRLNLDRPHDEFYVHDVNTLRIDHANQAELCLGYFWHLSVDDTRRFCDGLKYIVYYRPEDVSFTELFERLGITFDDISSEEVRVETHCYELGAASVVARAQCKPEDIAARPLFKPIA
jgi:hypothetical protein